MSGGLGEDLLDGGVGADSIAGGDGSDTLTGGAGADTLDAGHDADTFALQDGFGSDVIEGDEGVSTGTDTDQISTTSLTAGVGIVLTGAAGRWCWVVLGWEKGERGDMGRGGSKNGEGRAGGGYYGAAVLPAPLPQ